MKRYAVTLTGETALLMHADNLVWAEAMNRWQMDPENKKLSVAGDDRTPAWRWIGNLYHEMGRVVIPSDNLMTVLREGGTKVLTGKNQKSFKAQTQSGIIIDQSAWDLTVDGATIPFEPIKALVGVADFEKHEEVVTGLGFELFVKRAKIGAAKHVRVRPRFDTWAVTGSLTVIDDTITTSILASILTMAGTYCGLGDWRPSSPKSPGPFGKFTAEIKEL